MIASPSPKTIANDEAALLELFSKDDIREIIRTIIKYYGCYARACRDLNERGINITPYQIYKFNKGIFRDVIENIIPYEDFLNLKTTKIKLICEALVRNNGSVMATYNELCDVIPGIKVQAIETILYKQCHVSISDKYFEKDQYKKRELYSPKTNVAYEPEVGPDECWRPIVYEDVKPNMYQVSNYGRIKNLVTGQHMYASTRKVNRPIIRLRTTDNGKRKGVQIDRLVAITYVPNPHNKPQVNHMDLNPCNNYYKNLEWCTAEENIFHYVMNSRFTGVDEYNMNQKRALYLKSHKVPLNEYNEKYGVKPFSSEVGEFMFSIVNNTIESMNRHDLIFNDLRYQTSIYVFIYTVDPVSYITLFAIPENVTDELIAAEINQAFNYKLKHLKKFNKFTIGVIENEPLDEPYWDERYIEEYGGYKFLNKDIPYEISKYMEFVINKLMES